MFRMGEAFMQENYFGPLEYAQERANEAAMKVFLQRRTSARVAVPPPVGSMAAAGDDQWSYGPSAYDFQDPLGSWEGSVPDA